MIQTKAGKLQLIMDLMGGKRTDPETGEEYEMPALITKEQALELLNAAENEDEI